jgi:hypothetical protein
MGSMALLCLHAQSLTGKIVGIENAPIQFANVILLCSEDSSFVQGTTTDVNGIFKLLYSKRADLLRVSYIGYVDQFVAVRSGQTTIGTITLKENTQLLNEVVVRGDIPSTRIKGEALETRIAGTILEKVGTANDVLAKLPGISLQRNSSTLAEELQVFGRGVPTVYIDGREVYDMEELSQLSSDNIQSVEVITNPGARYAKSIKAVIRITLKQNPDDGLGLVNRAMIQYNDRWSEAEQLSMIYRKGKYDASALIAYNHSLSTRLGNLAEKTYLPDTWTNQMQITQQQRSQPLTATFALNYLIDNQNSLGGKYRFYRQMGAWSDFNFGVDTYRNNDLAERSRSDISTGNASTIHEGDIYYTGRIDSWAINLNGTYLRNLTNGRTHSLENMLFPSEQGIERVTTASDTRSDLYAAKLFVAHPLWSGEIAFGGEYSHTARRFQYNNEAAPEENDYSRVAEGLGTAFVEYGRSFGALEARVGLRFEHTVFDYYKGGVWQSGQSRNYNNWFPSASLTLPIGKTEWQLAYSSDVTRPTYNQLSEAIVYVNSYIYSQGNPFLLPNITNSLTLKGTYRWLQLRFAFEHNKDEIHTVHNTYKDNPSIIVETVANVPAYNDINFSLSASPTIGVWVPKWELGLYKQWYEVDAPGQPAGTRLQLNRLSPSVSWQNAFRLPSEFLFHIDASWDGRSVSGNAEQISTWRMNVSLYREFLGGRLTCLLQGNDLFHTSRLGFTVYSSAYHSVSGINKFSTQSVALTLTYKFNPKRSRYKGMGAGGGQKNRL